MARFRKRPHEVMARRLGRHVTVEGEDDAILHGAPGDWLITDMEGAIGICTDSDFRELYEPVDSQAIRALEKRVKEADIKRELN